MNHRRTTPEGIIPNGWHTLEYLAYDVECSYLHLVRSQKYRWMRSSPPPRVIVPPGEEVELGYVYLNPDISHWLRENVTRPSVKPGYPSSDWRAAMLEVKSWMRAWDVQVEYLIGLEPLP